MINKISDKIVFSGLKLIKNGKLNVTTFQNKKQKNFFKNQSIKAAVVVSTSCKQIFKANTTNPNNFDKNEKSR